MQLHFVSYYTTYPNVSVALTKSDGLAVLGVFIEVQYPCFLTSTINVPINGTFFFNKIKINI